MSELPPIFRDKRGVIMFRCPVCQGDGRITVFEKGAKASDRPIAINPCGHCFGFGRLPVPGWYTRQIVENATGDSTAFVDDILAKAKGDGEA